MLTAQVGAPAGPSIPWCHTTVAMPNSNCGVRVCLADRSHSVHMKHSIIPATLLLVALVSAASAAKVPRRVLLNNLKTCEDKCQQRYDTDWNQCLTALQQYRSQLTSYEAAYQIDRTAQKYCQDQEAPALQKCKAACQPAQPPEGASTTASTDAQPPPADPTSAGTKATEPGSGVANPTADASEPGPAVVQPVVPKQSGSEGGKD
jgi:hypothetical protein